MLTENMFVDAGMKFMDLNQPRSILRAGKWSMTHSPTFVKQVVKAKRQVNMAPRASLPLPGTAVDGNDPVMGYFSKIGEQKGWHHLDQMAVNGAFGARTTALPSRGSAAVSTRTARRLAGWNNCHQWRRLSMDEA